ncbi:LOW QUALITY PROTEIN: Protein CBG10442, partial [Caenorhabditis briggsae]
NNTVIYLCTILTGLVEFTNAFASLDIYIFVSSVVINLCHFSILTRKSMRSTSINLVMASVAVADILSQIYGIYRNVEVYLESQCYDFWYYLVFYENKLFWLQTTVRRYSTFLGFSISLIRTLVIRYPMSSNLEKLPQPKTSLYFITAVIFITLPSTVLGFFEYSEMYNGEMECENEQGGKYNSYFSTYSDFLKTITFVFCQIIPCLLYPFSTFLLVLELRKATESRKRLSSGQKNLDSNRTTKLILYLTLTFFVAEFPLGIIFLVDSSLTFQEDFYFLSNVLLFSFYNFFSVLLSLNTCFHMFICLVMSTQYREAVKGIVFC